MTHRGFFEIGPKQVITLSPTLKADTLSLKSNVCTQTKRMGPRMDPLHPLGRQRPKCGGSFVGSITDEFSP